MKKAFALFAVVLSIGMTAALDADAKRLGGGKSGGMQRQNISAPASPAGGAQGAPGQAASVGSPAAAGAPATAAAAAPKRNWMGPVAGLAAGLGLAALASHLGFGEALGNMMMIGLILMAVLLVVGLVLRKRAPGQAAALAGAGGQQGGSVIGSRLGGSMGSQGAVAQPTGIPADFDALAFARNAEAQFIELQAANDARDLERLRGYLTPEMFELVRADIDARGNAPQNTQVFGLRALVLDVVQEETHYVVSVRFTGSVRDQHGAVPENLDEVWHLTKSRAGQAGWVIAGIQHGGEDSRAATAS